METIEATIDVNQLELNFPVNYTEGQQHMISVMDKLIDFDLLCKVFDELSDNKVTSVYKSKEEAIKEWSENYINRMKNFKNVYITFIETGVVYSISGNGVVHPDSGAARQFKDANVGQQIFQLFDLESDTSDNYVAMLKYLYDIFGSGGGFFAVFHAIEKSIKWKVQFGESYFPWQD